MELDSDVGPNHLTSFQEQNFENCCNVPWPEYLEVDIAVFTGGLISIWHHLKFCDV